MGARQIQRRSWDSPRSVRASKESRCKYVISSYYWPICWIPTRGWANRLEFLISFPYSGECSVLLIDLVQQVTQAVLHTVRAVLQPLTRCLIHIDSLSYNHCLAVLQPLPRCLTTIDSLSYNIDSLSYVPSSCCKMPMSAMGTALTSVPRSASAFLKLSASHACRISTPHT